MTLAHLWSFLSSPTSAQACCAVLAWHVDSRSETEASRCCEHSTRLPTVNLYYRGQLELLWTTGSSLSLLPVNLQEERRFVQLPVQICLDLRIRQQETRSEPQSACWGLRGGKIISPEHTGVGIRREEDEEEEELLLISELSTTAVFKILGCLSVRPDQILFHYDLVHSVWCGFHLRVWNVESRMIKAEGGKNASVLN